MWDEPESQIKCELSGKERLLWSGRPRSGLVLRATDAFLIPFSLMWGGFAVFWQTAVVAAGAPIFFKLWGIPFVLVGVYLICGRFFVDAWQRAKTFYGVTSERVIIVSGIFYRSIKSINIDTLREISLAEKRDGSGTITFGPTDRWQGWFAQPNWPGAGQYTAPAFEFIDKARYVYETIRDAQREGARNAAQQGRNQEIC